MRKLYIALLSVLFLFTSLSKVSAQVNGYAFVPGTGGTLQDMSSGTTQLIGAASDDGVGAVTGIGFNFTFGGVVYTQFSCNANGLIRLGSTVTSNSWDNSSTTSGFLTSTNMPKIAAYYDDLATGTNGKVHYMLVGSAPNRKLVIEWKVTVPRNTSGAANAVFQAWLEETTNRITIVYGAGMLSNALNAGYTVGIASSPTDFISVTTSNNSASTSAANVSQSDAIASGTTYAFFPPPPCIPGSLAGGTTVASAPVACPGNIFTLSISGASFGAGLTYQWESSPDNATWTPVASATGQGLNTSETVNTYFRRKMTCSGTDAYSTSVQVTTSAPLPIPFTQDFTDASVDFPPSCWSADPDFNFGSTASAYGVGDGSVVFDFFDSFNGTNIDLSTAMFTATPANYRLTFDAAYATFSGEVDELQIWYSTNGGVTYSNLTTYLGGTSGALNTGGSSSGFFFPTSAQWKSFSLALPTGTNKLLFRGVSDFGNLLYVDNIRVELTPPCLPPDGLNISTVTTTTATLNWNAATTTAANGYQWEVRTSGAPGSGATGLAASGTTAVGVLTATATGLTASTAYSLYVRSDCGSSVISTWSQAAAFTTLCNPANVPYVQNFDAAISPDLPACVRIQDLNGATGWGMYYDGGTPAASQPNSIFYSWNASTPADDWFYIQGLNLTAGKTYYLRFKYKASDGPDFVENLEVKYGTAPYAASMTAGTIFHETNISTNIDGPFTDALVSFTPPSSGVYYLGFHAFSDADQAFLLVDDIMVESCPSPSDVTAVSGLPTTVDVSFTSSLTNFIIEYGTPGFTPGAGATAGTGGTVLTTTTSPFTITGLTAGAAYDVYVRTDCGGGDYSLNIKTSVVTQCTPANLPYTQDFETAITPDLPGCTSKQDINGDPGWLTATPPAAWGFPGNALWYIYSETKDADDWFFTRGINLTAGTTYQLSFKYGATDPLYPEKMEVKFGTEAKAGAMTTLIKDYPNIVANAAAPFAKLDRVSFTVPTTGAYYLGYHAYSDADEFQLFVDSINVKVLPLVDVGVIGLNDMPTCPVTNTSLHAYLYNYNLNTINFATNPVTVTANVTGAATTTLTATVNSGTLAPGDTLVVNLPAFNYPAGVYNVTTTSSNADDTETGNNANTSTVIVTATPVAAIITPAAPAVCLGKSVLLSTQFTAPPPAPVTLPAVSSGTISLAIPDADPDGTSHTLTVAGVPATAVVTGISVTINATHTFNSDLIFNLQAPNGKVLNLINARGGSGDGFTNTIISSTGTTSLPAGATTPVTGTFSADGSLNVGPTNSKSNVGTFAGLYSVGNGNWTISVNDNAFFDTGELTSWSITITYGNPYPTVNWSPLAGLYTDAAATIPYVAGTNVYTVYAKPTATTTYTATSISGFGCPNTSTVTVTVNPNPVVSLTALPTRICTSDTLVALSANPAGGSWSGIGVSGNYLVPPATAIGTYNLSYTYTDNLGCSTTASTVAKVENCPERVRLLRDDAVVLFPNPNNGQFNIRINSTLYNKLLMRVFTSAGSLARTQQFNGLAYGRVIPIDLTSLPGGSYMVQFYYNGGAHTADKTFVVVVGK